MYVRMHSRVHTITHTYIYHWVLKSCALFIHQMNLAVHTAHLPQDSTEFSSSPWTWAPTTDTSEMLRFYISTYFLTSTLFDTGVLHCIVVPQALSCRTDELISTICWQKVLTTNNNIFLISWESPDKHTIVPSAWIISIKTTDWKMIERLKMKTN